MTDGEVEATFARQNEQNLVESEPWQEEKLSGRVYRWAEPGATEYQLGLSRNAGWLFGQR